MSNLRIRPSANGPKGCDGSRVILLPHIVPDLKQNVSCIRVCARAADSQVTSLDKIEGQHGHGVQDELGTYLGRQSRRCFGPFRDECLAGCRYQ